MSVGFELKSITATAIKELYQVDIDSQNIQINETKPEFEGDYTVVLFGFIKQLKLSPDAIGNAIGNYLKENFSSLVKDFNIIKGFLNLTITDSFWLSFLEENATKVNFGFRPVKEDKVMIEYSSPNTNKPLHLGHLRNNFLGWSIAEILKEQGNKVYKTCVVNDRGIHICKSMIAWEKFGEGKTPETEHVKGDHFVGDYYVKFNDEYKKQVKELVTKGQTEEQAEKDAPIMAETQEMLVKWEEGDQKVRDLWATMNGWVYKGFDETYQAIGSDFDKTYYEHNTYLLGKDWVEKGLQSGVFFQKEDGSVWIDLTEDGLDQKLVRRKDGTSVYITQDIGLADLKAQEFGIDRNVYVVGDEQNYHFKVLKLICQKLGIPAADGMYHLSYGMVELPTGKMKSREGTVVDADDLVAEMIKIAAEKTAELGKVDDFEASELDTLYNTIGLGALKFFLLRVDPKKKMIFNPEESIDFHGFTGPFVQYTHARIKSILRKVGTLDNAIIDKELLPLEKKLIVALEQYPTIVTDAADAMDPSGIAIYVFNLAKTFNQFYAELSITNAETTEKKALRVQIATLTATTIKRAMHLLGINVPERM
ncbi:MAG: arginine--tRNA ligase [Pseudopedobacter saltans]|uniref:Arginine--tRNA ligase n=1 Tax=Pseudopedobacter saltans TaxID=151895 RepID=A0A2W5F979_9SPHI|nr:MAG: arginine--tRNA ligase [Pseudopedobacter saltans]